jgi:hypothetical protein
MWGRQKKEAILRWLAMRVPRSLRYYAFIQATADYSIEVEPNTEAGAIRAIDVVKVLR